MPNTPFYEPYKQVRVKDIGFKHQMINLMKIGITFYLSFGSCLNFIRRFYCFITLFYNVFN